MEILVCQKCGAILRQRGKNCNLCGASISKYAVTSLPVITQEAKPLVVNVTPDPMVLERLVSKRQVAMVLERPVQAGATDGQAVSGNLQAMPGNGLPARPIGNETIAVTPLGAGGAPSPANNINPTETPGTPFGNQPTELTIGAPAVQPAPAQSQQTSFFPGTEPSLNMPGNGAMPFAPAPGQGPTPTLKVTEPAPEATPTQPPAQGSFFAQPTGQAVAQAQAMGGFLGAGVSGGAPMTAMSAPTTMSAPQMQAGTTAPAGSPGPAPIQPQPSGQFSTNGQIQQPNPQTVNPAGAAPAAATDKPAPAADMTNSFNVTFGTAFDFFGNQAPAHNGVAQTSAATGSPQTAADAAPGAVPANGQAVAHPPMTPEAIAAAQAVGGEYQLGERADFFASPAKSIAPQIVLQNAADMNPMTITAPPSSVKNSPTEGLNPGLPPSAGMAASHPKPAEQKTEATPGDPFQHEAAPKDPPTVIISPSASSAPAADDSPAGKNMAAQAVMDFFSSTSFKPAPASASESSANKRAFADPEMRSEKLKVNEERDDSLVDEDDDIKPKVARPRGYSPKKSSSKKSEIPEDEPEEESTGKRSRTNHDVPVRRSFSGGSKADSAPKEELEEGEEPNFLRKQVVFAGMEMTRQNQIMVISILTFVMLIMGNTIMQLFSGMSPAPGTAPKPQQSQLQVGGMPAVSGGWTLGITDQGNNRISAGMNIAQSNYAFEGDGKDKYGTFKVENGALKPPNKIHFEKRYFGNDGSLGKPIAYEGDITLGTTPLYVKGIWHIRRRVGMSWRAQEVDYQGLWEGNLTDPRIIDRISPPPAPPNWWERLLKMFGDKMEFSTKCLIAAIGVIAMAGGAVFGSFMLFGPGGKMNVWEKQKYIPSQFRSQHRKMVKELSAAIRPGGLPLGNRCEWKPWFFWNPKRIALTPEVRKSDPHILLVGAGDKGKTRLMCNMITHDIESNDRAVIIIDSDGGLTDLITKWIAANPKGREFAKRVSVMDPTYRGACPGYNPLEMPDDEDLQSAASSLVYGFKAIYTEPPGAQSQWNQQTANILRNAALLLMVNGKTLTDLPTLLNDNDFRDVLLESIERKKKEKTEYITLLDAWGQYKRLARTDQWITWVEPILNRVSPMLSDSRIRAILTKPVSDIKLKKIIEEKRILIVKVPKGQLDQNANLLGSLIVTGVKQAALSLANERNDQQNPVALYLDEFDNFVEKETIEAICTETEKFKIGFVGAIKTLQHLPEDFRQQIVIAFGTLACFALAKKDGDLLGPQMFRVDGRKIKHQTIQNYFNKVNTSPQFELISDEEKLNIDRVVGQEARTFFCYRVGTVAGVFHLKAPDFNDIPDSQVNKKLFAKMHSNSQSKRQEGSRAESSEEA